MDYQTSINECVKVWPFFDKGIFPSAMSWQRRFIFTLLKSSTFMSKMKAREYILLQQSSCKHMHKTPAFKLEKFIKFEKVIFTNTKKIGETKFINLVCSSPIANFELEYNSASYVWKVKKVMPLNG